MKTLLFFSLCLLSHPHQLGFRCVRANYTIPQWLNGSSHKVKFPGLLGSQGCQDSLRAYDFAPFEIDDFGVR